MPDTTPLVRTLRVQVDAVAQGADSTTEVGTVDFAGTVTAVRYLPAAGITGANTNTRTLSVTNRGSAGAGSTAVASLQFVSGTNATAHDDKAITLSGTAANLVVAAGDVLTFESTHNGTGIADPGGLVEIDVTRS